MGVNCLTTGITLKDADGLSSLTQLTVNHTVHGEWPGAAQIAACKSSTHFPASAIVQSPFSPPCSRVSSGPWVHCHGSTDGNKLKTEAPYRDTKRRWVNLSAPGVMPSPAKFLLFTYMLHE